METQGKRLRLLYPDLHGLERGEYLYGEKAAEGVAAFCIGVYPLTHDKEILVGPADAVRRGAARHRGDARPRLAPRRRGRTNTIVGIADLELHGEPAPWDSRARPAAGRRAVARDGPGAADRVRARVLPAGAATPAGGGPWPCPSHRVYGTGMSVDPTGRDRRAGQHRASACGFPVEGWCSEYDNAAYEVNIKYADAIPAADEAFLFKLLVREICERARQARDVPRPAARRSRRKRPARELLVPARGRLERVPRPERPGGPVGPDAPVRRRGCWPTTRGWPRSWRRTSTRTSVCSPTC